MTTSLSLLHRVWRHLPAAPRRQVAMRLATLAAPRPSRPPPPCANGVIVVGELSRASGLGEAARLMLGGLASLGVPAWPMDISRFLPAHRGELSSPEMSESVPPPGAALVVHVNPPLLPLVLARLPRLVTRSRRIVGLWSWELPRVPAAWHFGARFVHSVWAPSRFTADAVAELTGEPVAVVRPAVATAPMSLAPVSRADFGLPEDAVVVLVSFNLASSFVRKNPLGAIEAFRLAFGTRADRVLALKVGNRDHFPDDFARIVAATNNAANIRLVTQALTTPETLALTGIADIVMSLHRSEGFGLVPAEGMLLGKPVIATAWSSTLEFMDESCSALVRCRLIPVEDPRDVYSVRDAVWADPDIRHAAEWLGRLADSPTLRHAIGERGRQFASERLGTASLAEAVAGLGIATGQAAATTAD